MAIRRRLERLPVVGRALVFGFRLRTSLFSALRPLRRYVTWLFTSREFTNYTYDLSERNLRHLAAFVSEVTGVDYAKAEGYVAELNRDAELRDHVRSTIASSSEGHLADRVVRFGRRLGWYAIVRAVKPRVVVETGIDKGLGSVVLTAALKRNAEEGHPGRYYGTDINPRAGYLLHGEYAKYGQCLYGDSLGSLIQLEAIVDVFINDSDHSADYEAREYEIIAPKLTPSAIVIGDNAHATDELLRFALRTGRRFLYFGEEPLDHWYPGAGIGAAFRRDG